MLWELIAVQLLFPSGFVWGSSRVCLGPQVQDSADLLGL